MQKIWLTLTLVWKNSSTSSTWIVIKGNPLGTTVEIFYQKGNGMLPHAGDSLSGNFSSIANHLKLIWIENNRSVPKNWKCHQIKHIIRDLNVIRDLNRREQSYLPWLTSVLCILSCTSIRAPTSSGVVGGGRFPTKIVTMVIISFCQRGLMTV